jgi:hypothetical protein
LQLVIQVRLIIPVESVEPVTVEESVVKTVLEEPFIVNTAIYVIKAVLTIQKRSVGLGFALLTYAMAAQR